MWGHLQATFQADIHPVRGIIARLCLQEHDVWREMIPVNSHILKSHIFASRKHLLQAWAISEWGHGQFFSGEGSLDPQPPRYPTNFEFHAFSAKRRREGDVGKKTGELWFASCWIMDPSPIGLPRDFKDFTPSAIISKRKPDPKLQSLMNREEHLH